MAKKARHLKTPIQLWVVDQRKEKGLTPLDLANLTGVTEDTARGWESRGRPSEDALAILERKFGRPAPRDEGAPVPADLSALVTALNRQAAAMEQIVELLSSRLALPSDLEPPDRVLADGRRSPSEGEKCVATPTTRWSSTHGRSHKTPARITSRRGTSSWYTSSMSAWISAKRGSGNASRTGMPMGSLSSWTQPARTCSSRYATTCAGPLNSATAMSLNSLLRSVSLAALDRHVDCHGRCNDVDSGAVFDGLWITRGRR